MKPLKTLLFVDDESEIIEMAKAYFEEEGYRVVAADSAKQGLALLKSSSPDVMILDMKLPDSPGLVLLEESKKHFPKTRVIVNTGYVDQALIDQTERLGRDAFLQKPFDLFVLKEEIEKLIGLNEDCRPI